MSRLFLTDEDSDIAGYKRAKLETKSDSCSLVRSVTSTVLGPATTQITRTAGGTLLQWITDPLEGPSLTANPWTLHVWAYQNLLTTNAGLHLDIYRFTNVEANIVLQDTTPKLGTVIKDMAYSTVVSANAMDLNVGDRLVFRLSATDAGGVMQVGNVYISYNGLYPRAEGDTYITCPDTLTTFSDFRTDDITAIRQMLRDSDTGLTVRMDDDSIKRCLKQAINTYTVNRPRVVASYVSGDGSTFDFPLPNKWVWGFSRLVGLEYPAGEQIPRVLDEIDWEYREDLAGVQPIRVIRFKTIVPEKGTNNIWLQYTTRHDYTTDVNTIASEDFDAVLWLAASYCAQELASQGAGSSDSSIAADVVNYRDMQQRWSAVARAFLEQYEKRVIRPDSATPVGTTEEWKPILSTGFNFLWHGRRVRRVR